MSNSSKNEMQPNDWRSGLPVPILAEHKEWIDLYYDAWRVADLKKEVRPTGWTFDDTFVTKQTWMWDQVWITTFGKYAQGAHELVTNPMAGLNLFYESQNPETGYMSHVWPRDIPCIHNPIFTLGEIEFYNHCGDKERLRKVLPHLIKFYYYAKNTQGTPQGFYRTGCWNNGMDNCPTSDFIIDLTSEQAMVARHLSMMGKILGLSDISKEFEAEYQNLHKVINEKMWSETEKFYVDLDANFEQVNNWTIGSFWTLLARVANGTQQEHLCNALRDPELFQTPHMVPSLARRSGGYVKTDGDYWRGAVWIAAATMVIKGLQENGHHQLAFEVACNNLNGVLKGWKETDTFWECYNQEQPGSPGGQARREFVGWTGVAPITTLIEQIIGIRVNTPSNTISWRMNLTEEHGLQNLKWGEKYGKEVNLLVAKRNHLDEPATITVSSNCDFTLILDSGKNQKTYTIEKCVERTLIL